MDTLTYFLVKESFFDQLKQEFMEVGKMLKEFFLMIKEVTYDVAANAIGADTLNLLLIGVGTVVVIMILLAIINK